MERTRKRPAVMLERARKMRRKPTKAEERLWQLLRGKSLSGFKFRRQALLGRFIADFYCAEAHLVLEVDGEIHDTERQTAIDQERSAFLAARGLRVIRLKNTQVLENSAEILAEIKSILLAATNPPSNFNSFSPSPACRGKGSGVGGDATEARIVASMGLTQ